VEIDDTETKKEIGRFNAFQDMNIFSSNKQTSPKIEATP